MRISLILCASIYQSLAIELFEFIGKAIVKEWNVNRRLFSVLLISRMHTFGLASRASMNQLVVVQ